MVKASNYGPVTSLTAGRFALDVRLVYSQPASSNSINIIVPKVFSSLLRFSANAFRCNFVHSTIDCKTPPSLLEIIFCTEIAHTFDVCVGK